MLQMKVVRASSHPPQSVYPAEDSGQWPCTTEKRHKYSLGRDLSPFLVASEFRSIGETVTLLLTLISWRLPGSSPRELNELSKLETRSCLHIQSDGLSREK